MRRGLRVGSMLWTKAVAGRNDKDGINVRSVACARTVTRNLFSAMAAGPMAGGTRPGELAALHVAQRGRWAVRVPEPRRAAAAGWGVVPGTRHLQG